MTTFRFSQLIRSALIVCLFGVVIVLGSGSVSAESNCIIPDSGPWPPCATGGNTNPSTGGGDCVIPESGPWPPCATGGNTNPNTGSGGDCVIPDAGPWPPCATGGNTNPNTGGGDNNECIIPDSGPWPPCSYEGGNYNPPVEPTDFDCTTVSQLPYGECRALIDLYNSAGGENWTYKNGWLQNPRMCQWDGIGCANGHVQWISLGGAGLVGTLPASLSELRSLRALEMSGNDLIGTIPDSYATFANLHELWLSYNKLSGPLPEWIGSMQWLETLVLSGNNFTGSLPASYATGTSMSFMMLEEMPNLTGEIPHEFASIDWLTFGFVGSGLCEPTDNAFQAWVNKPNIMLTGARCDDALESYRNTSVVNEFRIEPSNAKPGDTVQIIWDVANAVSVDIQAGLTNPYGPSSPQFVGLAGSGSLEFEMPERGCFDQLPFKLYARDEPYRDPLKTEFAHWYGKIAWKFPQGYDAAQCPRDEAILSTIIEQRFENGFMIYIEAIDYGYALFNEGPDVYPSVYTFSAEYTESSEPFGNAPAGLQEPTGVLGDMWRSYEYVHETLGWALAAEQSFQGYSQGYSVGQRLGAQYGRFTSGLDGKVWKVSGCCTGPLSWEKTNEPNP